MKPFTALFGASAGTHAADQLALATLPLTATLVLHAEPGSARLCARRPGVQPGC